MNRFTCIVLVAGFFPFAAACSVEADEVDNEASEAELRTRLPVSPKGSNGGILVRVPSLKETGDQRASRPWTVVKPNPSQEVVATLQFGTTTVLPAGRYVVSDGSCNRDIELKPGVTLDLGAPATLELTFDQPDTFAKIGVGGISAWLKNSNSSMRLNSSSLVVRRHLLPSCTNTLSLGELKETRPILGGPGEIVRQVVPTTPVSIDFDAIDPAYPTTTTTRIESTMSVVSMTGGGRTNLDRAKLHQEFLVPTGFQIRLDMTVGSYFSLPGTLVPTTPAPLNLSFHRVEIEDMVVNGATVRGLFKIAGGVSTVCGALGCSSLPADVGDFPTHTGIDLPAGTWTITSASSSPVASRTEVVTLP